MLIWSASQIVVGPEMLMGEKVLLEMFWKICVYIVFEEAGS